MTENKTYRIDISGHSTKREWAVYAIIATHNTSTERKVYVGKVGDNRDGCNPVISRIGNHFSHNKFHSQLRKAIDFPEEHDYIILYSIFGAYDVKLRDSSREKIDEAERHLNFLVQQKIPELTLINPFRGVGISRKKSELRAALLSDADKYALERMVLEIKKTLKTK